MVKERRRSNREVRKPKKKEAVAAPARTEKDYLVPPSAPKRKR
jgi:hypothetical protein